MKTIMNSIVEKVRAYMKQNKLTAAQFAKRANLSLSTLNNILYGKTNDMTMTTVFSLAKGLGIPTSRLFVR